MRFGLFTRRLAGKGQWKGKSHEGLIEQKALLPLVTSRDIDPPFCKQNQYLIAPLNDGVWFYFLEQ